MGARHSLIRGEETPQVLTIAYNNRGKAYTAKGKYELAMQDYDQAIKLNAIRQGL
jgi:hypothetical protein